MYIQLLSIVFILFFPFQSFALTGKVISVADGDTITILDSPNKQHKIRLYGIDTPEKKQAFGKAAKKHTSRLTYKKQAILRHLGCKAITLSSGEGAVDFLHNNSVDLIILDMLMDPGISGLETSRRIMEFKPEQKAIIASGFSQQESIEEACSLGVADFIIKPYGFRR